MDFLGWRIQRHRKRGTGRRYVYVYPAKKALTAVMAKIKTACRQNTNHPLAVLLHQLNRMLRGSLGVLSLLYDVALKRFTESFCNTSAMCGARHRCCSEPCPLWTCNMCNTVNRRRR